MTESLTLLVRLLAWQAAHDVFEAADLSRDDDEGDDE